VLREHLHFDLPVEQLLRRRDTRFQLGFARQAKKLVPDGNEFLVAPSRQGLHVLARHEEALAPPVAVLRDAYGDSLDVQPPQVRVIHEPFPQEPVMHVRIRAEVRDLEAIKEALRARGARLDEEYLRSSYGVLRYEAPLARLLGLPEDLSRLTTGRAQHWTALSHYTRGINPGGDAA
jgi:hypothetical protein